MDRRQYLAALVAGFAGCAGPMGKPQQTTTDGATDREPKTDSVGQGDTSRGDVTLPVPRSDLVRAGKRDAIPAIVDPAFAPDWRRVGTPDNEASRPPSSGGLALRPSDTVVGVERDGRARAYPLRILNWHEVVNDHFDGPLLVTYCPLCGSAITAERTVEGTTTHFGVSGLLWRANLVMYDEATDSLWSQLSATAIRGPATGADLTLVPSTLTTWREWRATHPETNVLLPPPASGTIAPVPIVDYVSNPYAQYEESTEIGVGRTDISDERLHPKATVLGVRYGGTARAYPLQTVGENAVVNDVVGGVPVVVTSTNDGSLFAYERTVDGTRLTFENAGLSAMRADGSRWRKSTGRAVNGPAKGTRLDTATDASTLYWFAWVDRRPDTTVYGLD